MHPSLAMLISIEFELQLAVSTEALATVSQSLTATWCVPSNETYDFIEGAALPATVKLNTPNDRSRVTVKVEDRNNAPEITPVHNEDWSEHGNRTGKVINDEVTTASTKASDTFGTTTVVKTSRPMTGYCGDT